MIFYVETISNRSDRRGPMDPRNGWPTMHSSLLTEADSIEDARTFFEQKFPGDVLEVLPYE